jgi:hypothetical protein
MSFMAGMGGSMMGSAMQNMFAIPRGITEYQVRMQNARTLRERAAAEEDLARRQGAEILGQGRAIRGASGLRVESGTSLDVDIATAEAIEMRALRMGYPLRSEAEAEKASAKAALAAGFLGSEVGSVVGAKVVAASTSALRWSLTRSAGRGHLRRRRRAPRG